MNNDKVISIQEDGYTIHIGNMSEFIEDNELNKDEIDMLENLGKGQKCFVSSGQDYTKITRLK